jgi:hypothetical protein
MDRVGLHAVQRRDDARILRRTEQRIGTNEAIALAIAVGVDDDRRPALRGVSSPAARRDTNPRRTQPANTEMSDGYNQSLLAPDN